MRSRKRSRSIDEHGRNRDRWLISYADLMTLLLALFIVMYAASDKERAHQIAEGFSSQESGGSGILPGTDSVKPDADQYEKQLLGNLLLIQKTKMQRTSAGVVVSLSEAGFFAAGEAVINPDAQNVIETVADTLKNSDVHIRIEGHTDSTPISNAKYPSNWELSTARASTVLSKLIDEGITPQRLSAAGYAGFQPIADNSTPDGRAQNRRVDIVILNR